MTLRKRIDRLAAKAGADSCAEPHVVFLCEAGGETRVALLKGGGTLSREPDETEAAFMARASDGTTGAVFLPDNTRDALASGNAPRWAQSELVIRALRAKHALGK